MFVLIKQFFGVLAISKTKKNKNKNLTIPRPSRGNLPDLCKDCNRFLILQSPCDNPESCYRLSENISPTLPEDDGETDYTDYWNKYLEKNYPDSKTDL